MSRAFVLLAVGFALAVGSTVARAADSPVAEGTQLTFRGKLTPADGKGGGAAEKTFDLLQKHCADPTKIRTQLGFTTTTSLADGLRATIDWYRAHRDWWERQLWMRSVPVVGADGTIRHW